MLNSRVKTVQHRSKQCLLYPKVCKKVALTSQQRLAGLGKQ